VRGGKGLFSSYLPLQNPSCGSSNSNTNARELKMTRRLTNTGSSAAKLIFIFFLFAGLAILPVKAEVIKEFRSDINIEADGSVLVQESITIDFENAERHGILRQIPISVTRKRVPYTVDLKPISITDANDKPLQYRETRDSSEIDFKIGQPDVLVTGTQVYKIKYKVRRVINWIDGRPEFYWNATGDQWRFEIEHTDVSVKPPSIVPVGMSRFTSFYGPPGSKIIAGGKYSKEGDAILFKCKSLPPGQGLTVAVSMPESTLLEPTHGEELLWWLRDWWQAVVIPICVVAAMFALWVTGGRDVDGDKAIAVEWNPPKELTPAEVGTLIDERCDIRDITSTLIDLAVKGHLKIKEIKTESLFFLSNKDYEFEKTDPPTGAAPLLAHERLFLSALFPGLDAGTVSTLSSLRGAFYPALAPIRDAIYEGLMAKNLFRHNPEKIRTIYWAVAGLLLFLAFCFFAYSLPTAAGFFAGSIIVGLFVRAMPSRTAKGSALTRESLGFGRFVKKAEKERIRVLASEDPTIFGRVLPYAMVLGAADQWAQAFKELSIEPPGWYVSSGNYPTYTSTVFMNDLGSSLRSMEQTFSTAPASAGANGDTSSAWSGGSAFNGGGSGGGFGGGGGSSW
jgi:uncharacterized membrane protein YgcG